MIVSRAPSSYRIFGGGLGQTPFVPYVCPDGSTALTASDCPLGAANPAAASPINRRPLLRRRDADQGPGIAVGSRGARKSPNLLNGNGIFQILVLCKDCQNVIRRDDSLLHRVVHI